MEKQRSSDQLIHIGDTVVTRLVPVGTSPTYNNSGALVRVRFNAYALYCPDVSGSQPVTPNLGVVDSCRVNLGNLFWQTIPARNTPGNNTVPLLKDYERIVYGNSPRGMLVTNPCDHVKIDNVQYVPGAVSPTLVRGWRDNIAGCPRGRYLEEHFSTPSIHQSLYQFLELCQSSSSLEPEEYVEVSHSDLVNKLLNPFRNELGQAIAELRDIKSLLDSVSGKILTLKKAFYQIRHELKNIRIRLLKPSARKAVYETSSSYLEFKFGWEQVGSDLARLLAFTTYLLEHIDKLVRQNGKVQRFGFKSERSVSRSFYLGSTHAVHISGSCVSHTVVCAKISIPGLESGFKDWYAKLLHWKRLYELGREYYGLTATPRRLWNIVPYTFLTDQIVPIADYLDELSASRYDVQMLPVYHSISYKEQLTVTVIDLQYGSTVTFDRTLYKRKPGHLELFTTRKWFTIFRFSWISAALAGQRLTR